MRQSPSASILQKKLFSKIRPTANSTHGIHNPKGIAYLTQLRMGLSKLNFHKFKHNFKDTINPMCPVNDGIDDTEHYLLLCNSFREQRCSLLAGVNDVFEACGHSESQYAATSSVRKQKFALGGQQNDLKFNYQVHF